MIIETLLSGRFRLVVRNAYTHRITKTCEFNNVITNNGLNNYGYVIAKNLGRCWVGSGNTPPTANDDKLEHALAYTDGGDRDQCSIIAPSEPNWICTGKLQYRFEPGTIIGDIREIGISNRTTPKDKETGATTDTFSLWSRALITNSKGEPITITILPDEYLDVFYLLKMHPKNEDIPFSFNLGGVVYNGVSRLAWVQNTRCNIYNDREFGQLNFGTGITVKTVYNSNILGEIYESIKGSTRYATIPNNQSQDEYEENFFYRDCEAVIGLNDGNIEGGIWGLELGPANGTATQMISYSQIALDKPIPKNNTNAIKFTIRCRWGRYDGPIIDPFDPLDPLDPLDPIPVDPVP